MQTWVLYISLAGMVAVALCFISAIRASVEKASPGVGVEGRRSTLIWGLLIAGVVITVASLWRWPHDVHGGEGVISVNVTGAQWSWEIDKQTVPTGAVVVFNVHTKDVNHGMGVVDETGRLLFQTQGMPGYVNQVRYVFDQPGTYKVICLEFCGVAHHDMIDEFQVTTKKS